MSATVLPRRDSLLTLAAAYETWSAEQARAFLVSQGVKVRDSDTMQSMQKQLEAHADAASDVSATDLVWERMCN